MKLSIYCQFDDLDLDLDFEQEVQLYEDVQAELEKWLETADQKHQLLNESSRIGLFTSATKPNQLKTPLNFLYSLAKEFKLEFAIAMQEDNEWHEVCFFGYQEGRPDIFEVGCYLGL